MKKIFFNDKYGLTQAVLEGRKTMTRRIIVGDFEKVSVYNANCNDYFIAETKDGDTEEVKPRYQVGETVAVAQSYHALNLSGFVAPEWLDHTCEDSAGYDNKMFVKPELMPYRIRITDIKLERLQDISEEDCLREGLLAGEQEPKMYGFRLPKGTVLSFTAPRDAFAALIDRISGKGTWESNPFVFVYSFELLNL